MSWTIQIRRDLAANWTSIDPILASGEIGLETDTLKAKVGNGSTAWSGLSYWNPSGLSGGGGGGAVDSVFGRTGTVVAATGDYTAAQVGADASGAAATAQSNAESFATAAVATETTRAETAEALAAQKANNLSDLASASTARTNLGLGTAATQASSAFDASGTSATETTRAEAAEALLAPLAGAAFTGPVSHTESAAAGGILTVYNSHTTPTSPSVQFSGTTAGDMVLGVNTNGDTNPRLWFGSDGSINAGSGSAATDSVFKRNASNSWQLGSLFATNSKTTGKILVVQNNTGSPTSPNVLIENESAGDTSFAIDINADSQYRLTVDSNGKIKWGPGGSTAPDTDLYRASAGMLQTDTSLTVSGALTLGTALAISDGGIGAATAPQNEVFAGPATGGTGAPSFRTLVATDLPPTGYSGIFGDGSDGAATMDGTTTVAGIVPSGNTYQLTHNVFFTNLTINVGVTLIPAGYTVCCMGTLTNNGTIESNGNAGSASGTAGGSNGSGVFGGGRPGGAGTTTVGTAASTGGVWTGTGGSGGLGSSGAGGAAGTGAVSAASAIRFLRNPFAVATGLMGTFDGNYAMSVMGGSGGGGDGTNLGGGGGGGAGIIALFAWAIINNGTIEAIGGTGGTPTAGNTGGGGGGSGGLILGYTLVAWTAGTLTVTAGAGGSLHGTGANGNAGTVGQALNVVLTNVAAAAIDQTASDIQPVGVTASAGSKGLVADAGHVHSGLSLVATTGSGGYTLVNGTGTIISWTAPNDGNLHRFTIYSNIVITTLEVGGAITYTYTPPGAGTLQTHTLQAASQAAGMPLPTNLGTLIVAPNTTVSLLQSSALTGGAAIMYAEIWGS